MWLSFSKNWIRDSNQISTTAPIFSGYNYFRQHIWAENLVQFHFQYIFGASSIQVFKNPILCPLKYSAASSSNIWWQHLNGFKLFLIFVPELNKTCTHLWPQTPLANDCNRVFINLSAGMDVISRQLDIGGGGTWTIRLIVPHLSVSHSFQPAGGGRGAATNLGQMKHMSLFSSYSSSF